MASSKMYKASKDGICFVNAISVKLPQVVPDYQRVVLGRPMIVGDSIGGEMPQAKEAREWLTTYMEVFMRFRGRKFAQDGAQKRLKGGPDFRWTEDEIRAVGALAQWLINLDSIRNYKQTGVPTPADTLTVEIDNLIVREKIHG